MKVWESSVGAGVRSTSVLICFSPIMMLAQPKSAGDFNERRFILLLNDLTEGRNVGCALQELAKMKIPEQLAKRHRLIEKVIACRRNAYFEQIIDIIIRKNQKVARTDVVRKVRFAERKKPHISGLPAPIACFESTKMLAYPRFPLKGGPGIRHSLHSPFKIVGRFNPFARPPLTPQIHVPEALRKNPYLQNLYIKIVSEHAALEKIDNPTVDQVLDEMMLLNGPFHCG
ncbi:hypothetical protein L3Y34_012814 [Caenorhabditis briggsae]|uniref:Uncharacterized protein n=3 Tax=Caenorhabditis briggsae TaxID=6238 RepID=A0AAE9CWB5_CAEBR|nr:hypothetical protein L3Y34_012814 [Caenorhabditis briggsae]